MPRRGRPRLRDGAAGAEISRNSELCRCLYQPGGQGPGGAGCALNSRPAESNPSNGARNNGVRSLPFRLINLSPPVQSRDRGEPIAVVLDLRKPDEPLGRTFRWRDDGEAEASGG